jgi:Tol biopolymer transport system component
VTFGSGFEAYPALTNDGRMAFFSASLRYNIWRLAVDHTNGKRRGEPEAVTTNLAYDITPQVSADGRHLVYVSVRPGERSIWVRDLETGTSRSVVDGPDADLSPVLNRDGTQVAYMAWEGPGQRAIYVVSTSGGDLPRKVCQPCGVARSWFADNRRLLVQAFRGRPTIEILDIETQKSYPVLAAEDAGVHLSRLSPDERWIAFTRRIDANRSRIMIAPLREGEATPEVEWIAVTEGAAVDDRAAWSPDGRRVYFTSDRSGFTGLYTRALDPKTKQPVGEVQVVRDFQHISHSLGDMDANDVSLAATSDALFFPLAEISGNIWLMHPRIEAPAEPAE